MGQGGEGYPVGDEKVVREEGGGEVVEGLKGKKWRIWGWGHISKR